MLGRPPSPPPPPSRLADRGREGRVGGERGGNEREERFVFSLSLSLSFLKNCVVTNQEKCKKKKKGRKEVCLGGRRGVVTLSEKE